MKQAVTTRCWLVFIFIFTHALFLKLNTFTHIAYLKNKTIFFHVLVHLSSAVQSHKKKINRFNSIEQINKKIQCLIFHISLVFFIYLSMCELFFFIWCMYFNFILFTKVCSPFYLSTDFVKHRKLKLYLKICDYSQYFLWGNVHLLGSFKIFKTIYKPLFLRIANNHILLPSDWNLHLKMTKSHGTRSGVFVM